MALRPTSGAATRAGLHPYLRGGGSVINVSSGAASIAGPPRLGIYGTVKGALHILSRAAALEWAADGIRVNTLTPLAMSPAFEEWERNGPDTFAGVLDQIPLRRMGHPEHDIGRAVVFLLGPDATMITGTTLAVDGGGLFIR
jgi:meso-butanediol dehydrogenase/(S,S)-butanediol dehydrogenase/diacetyl reductase